MLSFQQFAARRRSRHHRRRRGRRSVEGQAGRGKECSSHSHPLPSLPVPPPPRLAALYHRPSRSLSRGGGAVAPPSPPPSHLQTCRCACPAGAGRCGLGHWYGEVHKCLARGGVDHPSSRGAGGRGHLLRRHQSTWPTAGPAVGETAHRGDPARGEQRGHGNSSGADCIADPSH